MREIVLDTETTGRDPQTGDRIVELACVELIDLVPTGRHFHRYLNPERDVPEEVVRIHGLTGAFLADKPLFSAILGELLDFLADAPLVAHNAEFDRGFINAEFLRCGALALPTDRFVDTLAIARAKFRGAANSLDALARRFMLERDGFDLSTRKGPGGHGALVDSKMLARIYLELRGGREQALVFAEARETASDAPRAAPAFVPRPARPKPLTPLLTPEEEAAHAALVADLGPGALWVRAARN